MLKNTAELNTWASPPADTELVSLLARSTYVCNQSISRPTVIYPFIYTCFDGVLARMQLAGHVLKELQAALLGANLTPSPWPATISD